MASLSISPGLEEAQEGKTAAAAAASQKAPSMDGTEAVSLKAEDILSQNDLDPALNMKMHLVNNAIDQIGWTPYHMKLFVLNGFGYGVDSLILLLQSIVAAQAFKELGGGPGSGMYDKGLNVAAYCGMLCGALFWGLGADMVGRRWAFNCSLFICSSSAIVAGAMPSWAGLGVFVALVGFGGGGNLVLDTTVFLEYLPSDKQWVLTLMACWWGVGQFIAGVLGWAFLPPPEWNCATAESCSRQGNMGWRYVFFTGGALVFVMSVLRVAVVRLRETPKYLLGIGDDAGAVEALRAIAIKYDRPCTLTAEQLTACGDVQSAHNSSSSSSKSRFWLGGETLVHVRGLFATPLIARSTLMVWLSWTLIGLAYPLFHVFLPDYLAARGAALDVSTRDRWRNYMLVNVSGIFGPVLAGFMCNTRILGRRYTMVVGALATMAFLFGYTAVRTAGQDLAFSCTIGFLLNIYYGTLYAYTPEVLPSAHRATGNGVAVACNRVMGILSNVVATFGDTKTTAPMYVCAALFVAMAVVSALFPFEPYGRRSS